VPGLSFFNLSGVSIMAEKDETAAKWNEILEANPVLKGKGFAAGVKRWNALREAGEKAGLTGEALAAFIAHGMQKGK
jgi:ribosomal protein L3